MSERIEIYFFNDRGIIKYFIAAVVAGVGHRCALCIYQLDINTSISSPDYIFASHCELMYPHGNLVIFSPLPPGEVGTPLGVTGEGELTISIILFQNN